MAVYKIFPEKDATLYEQYPSMNTGLDQILEASSFALFQVAGIWELGDIQIYL